MKKRLLFGIVTAGLLMSGCSRYENGYKNSYDLSCIDNNIWNKHNCNSYNDDREKLSNITIVKSIGEATFFTTRELTNMSQLKDVRNKTVAVTSIVGVNNLKYSSDFGRLYSDSMLSDFIRAGWKVVDYRGVQIVTENESGEFYLDRERLKALPANTAIFVGTYGEYNDGLILNLRLLNVDDNSVISASNVQLEDVDLRTLYNNKIKPSVRGTKSEKCFSMEVK